MAVRTPLYVVSNNLQEMTSQMITEIRNQVFWKFIESPTVRLEVVGSGGSLSAITDTRLQAGASSTSTTATPSEATTAEPSTVSTSYSRINQTTTAISEPADTSNVRYPLYYNASGNLQSMSQTDMYDTFIAPAISSLADSGNVFTISTSNSIANYSLVSETPVFIDTRADTSAYTAAGIPETLDQPITITSFYLHKRSNSSQAYTLPVTADVTGNITTPTSATFNTLLSDLVRYAAVSKIGSKIRYNINGAGSTCGSGMTDTILSGSGNYQTLFVGANDYRAQEFPDGTPVTASTYFLRSTIE